MFRGQETVSQGVSACVRDFKGWVSDFNVQTVYRFFFLPPQGV